MTRRGLSEEQRCAAAIQGGQRMIATGGRPLYRVTVADGSWAVDGCPWLSGTATSRHEALAAARGAVAAMLEVDGERFDVEAG